MNSTPNTATASPDAVLAARANERLTHAYEQIALADEQLARVTEKLSNMERDSQRRPAAVSPPRSSRDRPALRGLVGLVLAGCMRDDAQIVHWDAIKVYGKQPGAVIKLRAMED